MVENGEVFEDTSIKTYKKLNGDKVIAYFVRQDSPLDKPAVVERGSVVKKPQYFGIWEDKTEEYLAKQKAKKEQLKKDKQAGIVSSSGRHFTEREIERNEARKRELEKAKELLAQLMADGGKV